MSKLPIAFSFAEWTCRRCKQTVHWRDTIVIDQDDLFCVLHKDCVEEEDS